MIVSTITAFVNLVEKEYNFVLKPLLHYKLLVFLLMFLSVQWQNDRKRRLAKLLSKIEKLSVLYPITIDRTDYYQNTTEHLRTLEPTES